MSKTHKATAKIVIKGDVPVDNGTLKVFVRDTSLQDVAAETVFFFEYQVSHASGKAHDIAPSIEFPADIARNQTWTWSADFYNAKGRLAYCSRESYPIDFNNENSEVEVVLLQTRTCGNE